MSRKAKLASISCALALGLAATTGAQAAEPQIEVLDPSRGAFERSIETQKLELRYRELSREAADLDVAPDEDLLASADTSTRAAPRRDRRSPRAGRRGEEEPDFGPAAGVSQETLDAIASCESGGDPTAVDASGTYYGKYQFDTGTWASVGGSGSPAEPPRPSRTTAPRCSTAARARAPGRSAASDQPGPLAGRAPAALRPWSSSSPSRARRKTRSSSSNRKPQRWRRSSRVRRLVSRIALRGRRGDPLGELPSPAGRRRR